MSKYQIFKYNKCELDKHLGFRDTETGLMICVDCSIAKAKTQRTEEIITFLTSIPDHKEAITDIKIKYKLK